MLMDFKKLTVLPNEAYLKDDTAYVIQEDIDGVPRAVIYFSTKDSTDSNLYRTVSITDIQTAIQLSAGTAVIKTYPTRADFENDTIDTNAFVYIKLDSDGEPSNNIYIKEDDLLLTIGNSNQSVNPQWATTGW